MRAGWKLTDLGLRANITDEGVWRIRRARGANAIELFKGEEVGHGSIITDEFMNWRIKLSLMQTKLPTVAPAEGEPPEGQADATGL
jgi:RAT1-interacting protein